MTETAPAFKPTPGRVKVANEVIAQIAGLTALQIPGVAGVADRNNQLTRVIRRGGLHKGVRVELVDESAVRIQTVERVLVGAERLEFRICRRYVHVVAEREDPLFERRRGFAHSLGLIEQDPRLVFLGRRAIHLGARLSVGEK